MVPFFSKFAIFHFPDKNFCQPNGINICFVFGIA